MTIEEAIDTLNKAGMIYVVKPGLGREFSGMGVRVENYGEEIAGVMIIKITDTSGYH